ncbi:MAG: orotidine-5'-phosphate decarboxylase [Candidatus Paceibacterota bacterium]
MLSKKHNQGKFVCVGLDSDVDKIPMAAIRKSKGLVGLVSGFNQEIVDATKDIVCAYKPNIAFYAANSGWGFYALNRTVEYIRKVAPDVPIIIDGKFNDIGNTVEQYRQLLYNTLSADAITVNPYLGAEALQPFLKDKDKGIIVLCRTSNKGGGEFQSLRLENRRRLFEHVAYQVANEWNVNGNCAVVVGGTYPEELGIVRGIIGEDMPILVPGIGTQGGDLQTAANAGKVIINSSSGIIFASDGDDFAACARKKTLELHNEIAKLRQQKGQANERHNGYFKRSWGV